jgi:hypothetical protein
MTHSSLGADCGFPRFVAFTMAYPRRDYPGLVEQTANEWKTATTPYSIEGTKVSCRIDTSIISNYVYSECSRLWKELNVLAAESWI